MSAISNRCQDLKALMHMTGIDSGQRVSPAHFNCPASDDALALQCLQDRSRKLRGMLRMFIGMHIRPKSPITVELERLGIATTSYSESAAMKELNDLTLSTMGSMLKMSIYGGRDLQFPTEYTYLKSSMWFLYADEIILQAKATIYCKPFQPPKPAPAADPQHVDGNYYAKR